MIRHIAVFRWKDGVTTDQIAERVRKLGGTTLRSIGHIARTQRLSSFYDTKIVNKDGVGHVAL